MEIITEPELNISELKIEDIYEEIYRIASMEFAYKLQKRFGI